MLLARGVDEEAALLQNQGHIDLWPSCQGQEAAQVGTAVAMGPDVTVFPSYREHAVALTRNIDVTELMAQWAGRTFCGWKPHEHRFFPYTLVLASQCLHAVGYSIGRRHQHQPATVAVYFGDGASSEGEASEALNLAAVESASVLFICQNNGWAISKPTTDQMKTDIATRAAGFGIRSAVVDGTDPEDVWSATRTALRHIARHNAPYLLEVRTHRLEGHSSSDDQNAYRPADDIRRARGRDPVRTYIDKLTAQGVVSERLLGHIDDEVAAVRSRMIDEFRR
ncbi:thiamine pyrophosphate-dependent dehydrogenase E1 component subunit alpha [Millisia brevis]|uniref:thiamine pyrophosphate-dependent dehydrogenase E1 component subunit alpha n=1 Tax=Millisia brevis TaxID=264148 RepID=UPI00082B206E|nr:thiamine pyrophosphate-dependent dehydrogenase E1 component subunit alpha [Millisia brevis]